MKSRSVLPFFLVCIALVAILGLGACGGGGGDASGAEASNTGGNGSEPSKAQGANAGQAGGEGEESAAAKQAYRKVLRGLRDAAVAGSTFNAIRQAKALQPAGKAVVEAFCYLTWQIGANREAAKLAKHAYIVGRIAQSAEYDRNGAAGIEPAMNELRAIVDLNSLDAKLSARYAKACEH